jgi:hypothetical protein
MRRKSIIQGLKNSQKIRIIVDGVGFHTTVQGMTEMCFTEQRVAVWQALEVIARDKLQGYGSQLRVYDYKMIAKNIQFQVNLV